MLDMGFIEDLDFIIKPMKRDKQVLPTMSS